MRLPRRVADALIAFDPLQFNAAALEQHFAARWLQPAAVYLFPATRYSL